MNPSAIDIDRIVREVLSRLAELPSVAAPVATTPEPQPQPKLQPQPTNELAIDTRVVTVESLRNRLAGVSRLIVKPGSVVTPAVRDLLRERKISLHQGPVAEPQTNAESASTPDVVIALCNSKQSPAMYRDAAPATLTCLNLTAASMARSVRQVAAAVAQHRCLGVVVTTDPYSALCLASRQKSVRAALAMSNEAIEQAIATAGANVLIIDGAAQGSWQIKRLIATFCRQTKRQCPDVLLETP